MNLTITCDENKKICVTLNGMHREIVEVITSCLLNNEIIRTLILDSLKLYKLTHENITKN